MGGRAGFGVRQPGQPFHLFPAGVRVELGEPVERETPGALEGMVLGDQHLGQPVVAVSLR